MFKRVEKRIRKKEKEEELGLDEETKEMLGLNAADTDSDESVSSEDEGSDIGAGDGQENSDSEADETENDEGKIDMGQDEEEEEDEDEEEDILMKVSEAMKNPLWHVSLDPEVKACAVCPGKALKNLVMIDVHMNSGAHKRRFAKMREAAMSVDPNMDVRDLVRTLRRASQPEKQVAKGKLSKRAEKKKAKVAALKAKRAKQKLMKAKYRAKKAQEKDASAAEDSGSSASEDETPDTTTVKPPASKKRKVTDASKGTPVKAVSSKATPEKKQMPTTTTAKSSANSRQNISRSAANAVRRLQSTRQAADTPSKLLDRPTAKPFASHNAKLSARSKRNSTAIESQSPIDAKLRKRRRSDSTG